MRGTSRCSYRRRLGTTVLGQIQRNGHDVRVGDMGTHRLAVLVVLVGSIAGVVGSCGRDGGPTVTDGRVCATSGSLDDLDDTALFAFELRRGDVVRYRVETTNATLDLVIGTLTTLELAEAASSEYAQTFPEDAANFFPVRADRRFAADLGGLGDSYA